MRVLGLDPSSRATGWGLIETREEDPVALAFGALKPPAKADLPAKLLAIKTGLDGLIARHRPDEIAVENPFLAKNTHTALLLGQVRGAVLVAVAGAARPLFEYSALEIKKAVTGYGQAEKAQVGAMVRTLFGLQDRALEEDAADALACALCHLNTRRFQRVVEESTID